MSAKTKKNLIMSVSLLFCFTGLVKVEAYSCGSVPNYCLGDQNVHADAYCDCVNSGKGENDCAYSECGWYLKYPSSCNDEAKKKKYVSCLSLKGYTNSKNENDIVAICETMSCQAVQDVNTGETFSAKAENYLSEAKFARDTVEQSIFTVKATQKTFEKNLAEIKEKSSSGTDADYTKTIAGLETTINQYKEGLKEIEALKSQADGIIAQMESEVASIKAKDNSATTQTDLQKILDSIAVKKNQVDELVKQANAKVNLLNSYVAGLAKDNLYQNEAAAEAKTEEDNKGVFNTPWEFPDASGLNKIGTNSVPSAIAKAITLVMGILGSIALAMVVYGGILYMTSMGNSERQRTGMLTIVWSAMGIAVIFASYLIVKFLFEVI